MQHKTLLAALATAGAMTIAQAAHHVTITTKIVVDSSLESDVVAEARHDAQSLHEKYTGVRGIRSVESSVDSDRCPCNKPKANEDDSASCERCPCNKPKPSANDETSDKCCGKPRPANDDATQEVRCDVCGKPKPDAKCPCNKPKASANEEEAAGDKCGCKPKPSLPSANE